ncbi:lysophospholipid acyltransferase family protein [Dankookia sp. GCM10030260]|uniref:lysophospholipid acyltransferase family protein n=1 Tax=Dankookia sp. GCM10030260 TaxID=3273390 RepID=UPI003612ABE3
MKIWLRSLLFNLAFWLLTLILGLISLPLLFGPRQLLLPLMRFYATMNTTLLRWTCGIHVRVEGRENLPAGGAMIVAAKHQSAFDTFIWFGLLPDVAYVMKQELLWVPVWGWFARKTRQIAVDRSAGSAALRHLVKAGKAVAAEGRQIVIFPEGTRVAPGLQGVIQPGIAALASATGLAVIPVATDSGYCWGRRAFRKRPGTIRIVVRPALPPGLPRAVMVARLAAAIELGPVQPEGSAAGEEAVDKPVESGAERLRR